MSESFSTVIPLPLSVVESNIWDATSWPTFLGDVERVERTAHERFVFDVRQGRRLHEVPVAVRWHARDHRVTWRELAGPQWRGDIRLTALNGRRTRVELQVAAHPRTFLASVAEMLGTRGRDVEADLVRLSDRLSTIPQPFNPARLTPTRRVGERSTAVTTVSSVTSASRPAVPRAAGASSSVDAGAGTPEPAFVSLAR